MDKRTGAANDLIGIVPLVVIAGEAVGAEEAGRADSRRR